MFVLLNHLFVFLTLTVHFDSNRAAEAHLSTRR